MVQKLRTGKASLNLSINFQEPVSSQIVEAIKNQIRKGILKPDTLIPSTRELALDLKINRKTVISAYQNLIDTGWLKAIYKKGTFVSHKLKTLQNQGDFENIVSYPFTNYQCGFREVDNSQNIVFNAGLPDPRIMPLPQLASAYRRLFKQKSRWRLMGYQDEKGNIGLREAISRMLLVERSISTNKENICITRGSQMALFLLANVLLNKNDKIAVENPGYMAAWEVFKSVGADVIPIPVDEDGLSTDFLEAFCKKNVLKAVYITPQHQYPTTVVLKAHRRLQLLTLADKYGFVIIEDDYDNEFHFKSKPVLPVASENLKNVIYISSFSKVISPSIRVGYIVAPLPIVNSVASLRLMIDRQGDAIIENAIAELLNEGIIKRHIRKVFLIYRKRRQAMDELLKEYLKDKAAYKIPDGGLAYWIKLNSAIPTHLLRKELLKKRVQIIASEKFSFENESLNSLRLGFASLDTMEMESGIKTIASVLEKLQHEFEKE